MVSSCWYICISTFLFVFVFLLVFVFVFCSSVWCDTSHRFHMVSSCWWWNHVNLTNLPSSPLQMVILVHRVILKSEKSSLQDLRNTLLESEKYSLQKHLTNLSYSPLQMVILVHRVILKSEKSSLQDLGNTLLELEKYNVQKYLLHSKCHSSSQNDPQIWEKQLARSEIYTFTIREIQLTEAPQKTPLLSTPNGHSSSQSDPQIWKIELARSQKYTFWIREIQFTETPSPLQMVSLVHRVIITFHNRTVPINPKLTFR